MTTLEFFRSVGGFRLFLDLLPLDLLSLPSSQVIFDEVKFLWVLSFLGAFPAEGMLTENLHSYCFS
jgi:hypothetical protein